MLSYSEIGVDRLGFFLDLVSKLVECFECGFSINGSEVGLLEKDVLLINVARHGG